jgi:starch synthase
MKVLFVATEISPFIKVGGLGDVVGSLPIALSQQGLQMSVIVPYYKKNIIVEPSKFAKKVASQSDTFSIEFDDRKEHIKPVAYNYQGVEIIFLENQHYFGNYSKIAIANDQEEVDQYAFFSQAVVNWLIKNLARNFEIIHLHDWHTGLIPNLYRRQAIGLEKARPKFIFTIHNLGYHGFSAVDLVKRMNLDIKQFNQDPYFDFDARSDNQLDLLLEGLLTADFITTVSPNYAREILTPEYCEGFCDLLEIRQPRMAGILNGIDYQTWDPHTDPAIWTQYSAEFPSAQIAASKVQNKVKLADKLGLTRKPESALLGYVGRLDSAQKGLDILYETLPRYLSTCEDRFVMLGMGESYWEDRFHKLAESNPDQISINTIFNEDLAHQIYAASDLMLIPSKYEPCGLVQMIAMRYGSLPLVRATGGLKDSVTNNQDGFVFQQYNSGVFLSHLHGALEMYRTNKEKWSVMIKAAMEKDFSWNNSARKYKDLYARVVAIKH